MWSRFPCRARCWDTIKKNTGLLAAARRRSPEVKKLPERASFSFDLGQQRIRHWGIAFTERDSLSVAAIHPAQKVRQGSSPARVGAIVSHEQPGEAGDRERYVAGSVGQGLVKLLAVLTHNDAA